MITWGSSSSSLTLYSLCSSAVAFPRKPFWNRTAVTALILLRRRPLRSPFEKQSGDHCGPEALWLNVPWWEPFKSTTLRSLLDGFLHRQKLVRYKNDSIDWGFDSSFLHTGLMDSREVSFCLFCYFNYVHWVIVRLEFLLCVYFLHEFFCLPARGWPHGILEWSSMARTFVAHSGPFPAWGARGAWHCRTSIIFLIHIHKYICLYYEIPVHPVLKRSLSAKLQSRPHEHPMHAHARMPPGQKHAFEKPC